jgi:hypothetical protein
VGDCLFSYRPPADIEQESMKRLTGHPALSSVPCTEAFVLTGDARLFDAIGLRDAPVEPLAPTPWLKKQRRQQKVFKRKGRWAGGRADLGEDRARGRRRRTARGPEWGSSDLCAGVMRGALIGMLNNVLQAAPKVEPIDLPTSATFAQQAETSKEDAGRFRYVG